MRGKSSLSLPDASRKQAIAALQDYFRDNPDDEIGDLKAGLLLDHILGEIGPSLYNQGLADARAFIEERTTDLAMLQRDEFPGGRKR